MIAYNFHCLNNNSNFIGFFFQQHFKPIGNISGQNSSSVLWTPYQMIIDIMHCISRICVSLIFHWHYIFAKYITLLYFYPVQITKTYRFKLQPTNHQKQQFEQWLGTCRFVYNLAKDCKESAYRKGKNLSYYDLKKQLPDLKTEIWIKDVHSQVLQDVIKRLDISFQNFFQGAGYPKWAVKGRFLSFNFPQGVTLQGNKIKLPKIGEVRFIHSQTVEGTIKQTKIKKEYDGWYVSITCQTEQKVRFLPNESQVGIDVGVVRYYTLSDGDHQNNPKFLYQLKQCLAYEQRKLATKQKRSKNWYKQLKVVQCIHTKIARKRKDFQHQQSIRLVRKYGSIIAEDLRLRNMSKSAKGTLENPGKNVKSDRRSGKIRFEPFIAGCSTWAICGNAGIQMPLVR